MIQINHFRCNNILSVHLLVNWAMGPLNTNLACPLLRTDVLENIS